MRQNNNKTICSVKMKSKRMVWAGSMCEYEQCVMTHMLLLQTEGYISPWLFMVTSGYDGANEVGGRETELCKKRVIRFKHGSYNVGSLDTALQVQFGVKINQFYTIFFFSSNVVSQSRHVCCIHFYFVPCKWSFTSCNNNVISQLWMFNVQNGGGKKHGRLYKSKSFVCSVRM